MISICKLGKRNHNNIEHAFAKLEFKMEPRDIKGRKKHEAIHWNAVTSKLEKAKSMTTTRQRQTAVKHIPASSFYLKYMVLLRMTSYCKR